MSMYKANRLSIDENALTSTSKVIKFFRFRTRIHGGITLLIIALYIIGFYMLTPEFMEYLAMRWIWLMDVGFVLIAITLFYFLRKTVVKELDELRELIKTREYLQEEG